VILETINLFKKKYENFVGCISKMDLYFMTNYKVEESIKTLSKCNKGHFMKYEKSKNRLFCEFCKEDLILPEVFLFKLPKIFI